MSGPGSTSSIAEQRAAATHAGGPLLILAGAGTGKTTTLCARVAWLVVEGVPPERILLLTFTRRAAREMLQRARGLVPASLARARRHVPLGRAPAVRRHAAALGLPGGFGVLDAGDAADVLDLLREEHGHAQTKTRFPKKGTLLDIYSRTVNAQQPLSGVIEEYFPWCPSTARRSRRCSRPTRRASASSACATSTTCCCTGARWRPTR